ncbi:MAG: IS110 family transposase [Holophagales bacterium]|nr:IS110 family transposase [Holophagales bacterium]
MAQTAAHNKHIAAQERLYVAFELGWTKWKLGFCSRLDEKAWVTTIDARDIGAMKRTIAKARTRFKVSATCPVASCYEAGRDGFWLDRLLKQMSVENVVVDSGSIKVDRRARRAKTDRLDAEDLVTMLVRYVSGEPKVWHVVHVPSPEQEDARHLQREIRTLKKEQTRIVNRVRGLLASQGVSVKMGRRGLLVPLEALRTWDGSPLPPGLTLRVGQELSRHVVVHEQMLALEAQRHRGIQEEGSANAAMSQRLMELKAIGETTAETLTREVFFRDFENRRQIGSYSGLTPSPYQSGDMSHESGISHAGNRHLRGIIVDVAWDWLRYQPQSTLARWYQKRFGSGGPRMRKIGIVALARKLLIALWRYAEFGVLPQRAQRKALAA